MNLTGLKALVMVEASGVVGDSCGVDEGFGDGGVWSELCVVAGCRIW